MNENERRRRWNERLGCWVGPTSESSGESTDPQGASGDITTRRLYRITKNMADAIREWEKAKKERESWSPVVGQMPPASLLDNAKIANELLTSALHEYDQYMADVFTPTRGESHTWATVDDIHDSDTPERQAQIRDIMTRNTVKTAPNQTFTGFDPGSPEGDYGARVFGHWDGEKQVLDRIEFYPPKKF